MGRNSLIDGNYQLRVDRLQISRFGGGPNMVTDVIFGDQVADHFFRYFSDADGDNDVDANDLHTFGLRYRQSIPIA